MRQLVQNDHFRRRVTRKNKKDSHKGGRVNIFKIYKGRDLSDYVLGMTVDEIRGCITS